MRQALDVIGDVHGQFDKLVALLGHLGYRERGGTCFIRIARRFSWGI
jgi:hypothetical protein